MTPNNTQPVDRLRIELFENIANPNEPLRRLTNVEVCAQYAQFNLPQAPVFHPYNPSLETQDRPGHIHPRFSVCLRLPKNVWANLPATVKKILVEQGVTQDKLQVFLVSQNMPWMNVSMLLRPHYWLFNAPANQVGYNNGTAVEVGLFDSTNPGINLDVTPVKGTLSKQQVSSHSDENNVIVSSPDNINLQGMDFQTSACLLSLAIDAQKNAALTIHWMLNDKRQAELEGIIASCSTDTTLETFITMIQSAPQFVDHNGTHFGQVLTQISPITHSVEVKVRREAALNVATATTVFASAATPTLSQPSAAAIFSATATVSTQHIDASATREAAARAYAARIQALEPHSYDKYFNLYLRAANDRARQAMVTKLEAERTLVEKAKNYAKSVLQTFAPKDQTEANETHHFFTYYNRTETQRAACDNALAAKMAELRIAAPAPFRLT